MKIYSFCWFWDQHCQIDLAAWVPVIGSLLALGITIFLYYHQIRTQRSQARESQIATVNHFANMANELLIEFQECLNTVTVDKPMLQFLAERMKDLVSWTGRFNIDTLNEDESINFFRVRDAVHKVALWVTLYKPENVRANKDFIVKLANQIAEDLNSLMNLNQ